MRLIVCLDDNNGMLFNGRRQSRDRVLIADMISHTAPSPLWISPFSAALFGEDCTSLRIAEHPTAAAGEADYCFVENTPLPQNLQGVSEIIIYRWNRDYPYDVRFTADMSAFSIIETTEFVGSSHDNITKEIWKR